MSPKRERPPTGSPEPDRQAQPPSAQPAGEPILAFEVAEQRFGLPVSRVIQIIEMVTITALPEAPAVVAGVINFHGRVIPVLDMRQRLNLLRLPYTLRTPIIISQLGDHLAGLVVDRVSGVIALTGEQAEGLTDIFAPETLSSLPLLRGVARQSDGLLLILDLEAFLSQEEERALHLALAGRQAT